MILEWQISEVSVIHTVPEPVKGSMLQASLGALTKDSSDCPAQYCDSLASERYPALLDSTGHGEVARVGLPMRIAVSEIVHHTECPGK